MAADDGLGPEVRRFAWLLATGQANLTVLLTGGVMGALSVYALVTAYRNADNVVTLHEDGLVCRKAGVVREVRWSEVESLTTSRKRRKAWRRR